MEPRRDIDYEFRFYIEGAFSTVLICVLWMFDFDEKDGLFLVTLIAMCAMMYRTLDAWAKWEAQDGAKSSTTRRR